MNADSTAANIITSARQMLTFATQAADDYAAGEERRLPALFNAVVQGRSVTFVLQNLRGHVDGFDEWYAEIQTSLRNDPVCCWFVKLRNRIEKQGTVGSTATKTYIQHLDTSQLARLAPTGTVSTFIGDNLGRNGWIVRLADGSTTTIYFALPTAWGHSTLHLEDAPDGLPVEALLPQWLNRLEVILNQADIQWGTGTHDQRSTS